MFVMYVDSNDQQYLILQTKEKMAMEVVYTFFVSSLTSKYVTNKSIGLKVAKYGRHFEVIEGKIHTHSIMF